MSIINISVFLISDWNPSLAPANHGLSDLVASVLGTCHNEQEQRQQGWMGPHI